MSKMTINEYKEAMCIIVNHCHQTLFRSTYNKTNTQVSEYFNVNSVEDEIKMAKSVSMFFYKAWYTESHDFDLMANIFHSKNLNIDQSMFIDGMINTALNMEDHNQWSIEKYPLVFFEDNDHTKPFYIKVKGI